MAMMDGIVKIAGQRTNYQRRMYSFCAAVCGDFRTSPGLGFRHV